MFSIDNINIFMEIIFNSYILKKVTYYSDVATGPLQGLLGCENMMNFYDKKTNKHQNTSFPYEKRSDNHFSHMNIDENTTPDRFEALPGLLDHLNDEFMMVLLHVYKHFRQHRNFKNRF